MVVYQESGRFLGSQAAFWRAACRVAVNSFNEEFSAGNSVRIHPRCSTQDLTFGRDRRRYAPPPYGENMSRSISRLRTRQCSGSRVEDLADFKAAERKIRSEVHEN